MLRILVDDRDGDARFEFIDSEDGPAVAAFLKWLTETLYTDLDEDGEKCVEKAVAALERGDWSETQEALKPIAVYIEAWRMEHLTPELEDGPKLITEWVGEDEG